VHCSQIQVVMRMLLQFQRGLLLVQCRYGQSS
jgi:hypothetical protein